MRARPVLADDPARRSPSTSSKSIGPVVTKLRPSAAALSQAAKSGGSARMDIGLAIAQLAAGGIVARPDAGEPIADVEDVVPVGQLDPAVDAELEELDGVDVLPDEVGVDRLGVAAVGIDGEAALLPGLAAERAVERPVVGVRPSALRAPGRRARRG